MRDTHVVLDEAVVAAYGWDDVTLDHGFHTYRQMERWTVSPAGAGGDPRIGSSQLNHERARAEGQDVPADSSMDRTHSSHDRQRIHHCPS